jgi:pimeloyl-ACP methyl ester carboxylesterase
MPTFDSNGVPINYIDEGSGPPIVLVHGFAASIEYNWRVPGIIDALKGDGRRVVALDCRGHGKSGKPHEPAAYADNAMANDVIALMDHLGIAKTDLQGYSMGGIISSWLLTHNGDRFNSVILSGIGDMLVLDGVPERMASIADAMESKDPATVENEIGRNFRIFAERTGNDLGALAAMQRAPRPRATKVDFGGVSLPVLVLLGAEDVLVGKADRLAAAIPGAELVYTPGDHLTAVAKPEFKQAILDFLRKVSPVAA